jgi:hypothetical protein
LRPLHVPVVSPRRRLALLLLGGLAFGIAMAVVKGQHDDVRNALGNASAPWVAAPFLAGMSCRRPLHGAGVGVAVTVAAFLGFYVAEAAILDLGPHPWYVDLELTVGTVYVYERFGLLSGVLCGALGSLWAARRSLLAAVAVGLAFVAEPLVVLALWRGGLWGGPGILRYPGLCAAEIALGIALTVGLRWRSARIAAA